MGLNINDSGSKGSSPPEDFEKVFSEDIVFDLRDFDDVADLSKLTIQAAKPAIKGAQQLDQESKVKELEREISDLTFSGPNDADESTTTQATEVAKSIFSGKEEPVETSKVDKEVEENQEQTTPVLSSKSRVEAKIRIASVVLEEVVVRNYTDNFDCGLHALVREADQLLEIIDNPAYVKLPQDIRKGAVPVTREGQVLFSKEQKDLADKIKGFRRVAHESASAEFKASFDKWNAEAKFETILIDRELYAKFLEDLNKRIGKIKGLETDRNKQEKAEKKVSQQPTITRPSSDSSKEESSPLEDQPSTNEGIQQVDQQKDKDAKVSDDVARDRDDRKKEEDKSYDKKTEKAHQIRKAFNKTTEELQIGKEIEEERKKDRERPNDIEEPEEAA